MTSTPEHSSPKRELPTYKSDLEPLPVHVPTGVEMELLIIIGPCASTYLLGQVVTVSTLCLARLGYITYPHTYTSASIPPNYGNFVHLMRRPLLAENKEGGRNRSDGYGYIPTCLRYVCKVR